MATPPAGPAAGRRLAGPQLALLLLLLALAGKLMYVFSGAHLEAVNQMRVATGSGLLPDTDPPAAAVEVVAGEPSQPEEQQPPPPSLEAAGGEAAGAPASPPPPPPSATPSPAPVSPSGTPAASASGTPAPTASRSAAATASGSPGSTASGTAASTPSRTPSVAGCPSGTVTPPPSSSPSGTPPPTRSRTPLPPPPPPPQGRDGAVALGPVTGITPLLDAFLHRAPPGAAAPPGCNASVRGRPVAPGGRPPFDRLLVLTMETRLTQSWGAHDGVCATVWHTLATKGARLLVLADEVVTRRRIPAPGRWPYQQKQLKTLEFLEAEAAAVGGLGSDAAARTAVVFVDGSDVSFQGSPEELLECLNAEWCAGGWDAAADVLLLGERGMWPPSDKFDRTSYKSRDDYRFINSGLYGGSWAALTRLLRATAARIDDEGWTDDQAVFHMLKLYDGDEGPRMHVQSNCQRCFGSIFDNDYPPGGVYVFNASLPPGGRVVHLGFKCAPVLLHHNGLHPKREMPGLIAQMADFGPWDSPPPAKRGGLVWFHNVSLQLSPPPLVMADVCGRGAYPAGVAPSGTPSGAPTPTTSRRPK